MDPLLKKVIVSAVGGLLAALLVDLDAWKADRHEGFNLKKAAARWGYGFASGALTGLGFGAAGA